MNCTFCEFISGKRKKHVNGFPFKPLFETKNTVTFLSIDFPATEKGHLIIIPKRHYENLEDIPKNFLSELISQVSFASRVLRKNHQGTNILLNNGISAGQEVMHVHFHIIPRNIGDKINLEHFKRKKMSIKQFEILHKYLNRNFRK